MISMTIVNVNIDVIVIDRRHFPQRKIPALPNPASAPATIPAPNQIPAPCNSRYLQLQLQREFQHPAVLAPITAH